MEMEVMLILLETQHDLHKTRVLVIALRTFLPLLMIEQYRGEVYSYMYMSVYVDSDTIMSSLQVLDKTGNGWSQTIQPRMPSYMSPNGL